MNCFDDDFSRLNLEQVQIIKGFKKPSVIIAGPGTGKTRTVAVLIGQLLREGFRLREILALTFSEKAAEELRERVLQYYPHSYEECWISTFHSFCARILRQNFFHVGIHPEFKLLTSFKEAILMQEICRSIAGEEFPYFRSVLGDRGFQQEVLTFIALFKSNLISPKKLWECIPTISFPDKRKHRRLRELARLFTIFQDRVKGAGYLDFRDLISLTVEVLRNEEVAEKLNQRFKIVLVDEFQDTDPAQYFLLSQLKKAAEKPRIAIIGDPRQSIYRFRGADPDLISSKGDFRRDYRAKEFHLFRNYRSGKEIVELAKRLEFSGQNSKTVSSAPPEDLHQKLIACSDVDSWFECFSGDDGIGEARILARQIASLTIYGKNGRIFRPSEIAVLVRNNYQIDFLTEALNVLKVPFEIAGDMKFFLSEEIRVVSSLLKGVTESDPERETAIRRAFSSPLFKIAPLWVQNILGTVGEKGNLLKYLGHLEEAAPEDSDQKTLGRAFAFKEMFHLLQDFPEGSLNTIIARLLPIFRDIFSRPDSREAGNLLRFRDLAFEYSDIFHKIYSRVPTLQDFMADFDFLLPYYASTLEAEESETRGDGVRIMTIHQSKGLEFPVVFIPGLCEGVFPVQIRQNTLLGNDGIAVIQEKLNSQNPLFPFFNPYPTSPEDHIEEERRLMFVAITRAQVGLVFSFPRKSGSDTVLPSIFLDELGLSKPSQQAESRPVAIGEVRIKMAEMEEDDRKKVFQFISDANRSDLSDCFKSGNFEIPAIEPIDFPQKFYFSAQSIKDYLDCPRRFFLRQILRIRDPLSEKRQATLRGKSVHACLEMLHQPGSAWEKGKFPDEGDLQEIWETRGKDEIRDLDALTKLTLQEEIGTWLESYRNAVYDLTQVPPRGTLGVEITRKFNFRGFSCLARFDRIVPGNDGLWIIDYKTGTPESSAAMLEKAFPKSGAPEAIQMPVPGEIQMPFYLLAAIMEGFKEAAVMTLYVKGSPYKKNYRGFSAGFLRSASLNLGCGPSYGENVDGKSFQAFQDFMEKTMAEITNQRVFDCMPSDSPDANTCRNPSQFKSCEFFPFCQERLEQNQQLPETVND